ncbi:MAG: hypothetical protein QOH41_3124 [Blastocatellia bacterium]|nr:hypothetical protein [Blastocatellia bacterium]
MGVILTTQAVVFAGIGHGSYAPMAYVASVIGLMPILALPAGPLLWALYFLVIPNLDSSRSKVRALCLVLAFHLLPGSWIAYQDPALGQASLLALLIFVVSFLATIGLLFFFSIRENRVTG